MKIELWVNNNFYKIINCEISYGNYFEEIVYPAQDRWRNDSPNANWSIIANFKFCGNYGTSGYQIFEAHDKSIAIGRSSLYKLQEKNVVIPLPAKEKVVPIESRFDILDL